MKRRRKLNFDNIKANNATSSVACVLRSIEKYLKELQSEDDRYDAVIQILRNVHNDWVDDNTSKYSRQGKLFQYLPIELIGLEELIKDLLFLEPFIDFTVGEYTETGFKPNEAFKNAYAKATEKFLKDYDVHNSADLKLKLPQIIKDYTALQSGHELAKARYFNLLNSVDSLAEVVAQKIGLKNE